jgi:AraC family transcriptional regulator
MSTATSWAIYEGRQVGIGQFMCPVTAPNFADTGPIQNGPIIVFPRIGVEITHAGHAPIVADPNTVVFYNDGQEYRRGKVSPQGDRCEWFAFAPALVREVVSQVDPTAADHEAKLFDVTHGPIAADIYFRQRVVVEHILKHPVPNALYIEETMLNILGQVVAHAYKAHDKRAPRNHATLRAHAEIIFDAKTVIAAYYQSTLTLEDIAGKLFVSPYHLCRVFRQETGTTLHHYLTQIRLRASLESVSEGTREVTTIAHDLGFSSHSHFTSAFRHTFGMPPSAFQKSLITSNFSNNLIA